MKKSYVTGILALVMLAAVLAAGCTTNPTTTSPTSAPGTSAATTTAAEEQSIVQYLTATAQQRGFIVQTPFELQTSSPGVAVWNATVSDQNGTYSVSVRSFNTSTAAQAQFLSLRNMYAGQGYSAVYQNATAWSGFNSGARMGAAVEYGNSALMPYYCMIITGGAIGQGSFQENMWMHMWDAMHERLSNGGGMGPYMGYGVNIDSLDDMQQEMFEHMGVGPFGPGMMSSS